MHFRHGGRNGGNIGARNTKTIMHIPEDNFIALSYINTKLRDEYSSLEEFCGENDLSPEDICARMAQIGYNYDKQSNSFRQALK